MRYSPRIQTPSELPDLVPWLTHELRRIGQTMAQPEAESLTLQELHAQPSKYSDGMIVFADGTDWNPGSGRGVYVRYASAWNKLG